MHHRAVYAFEKRRKTAPVLAFFLMHHFTHKVLLIMENNILHRFPLNILDDLTLAYFKGILAALGISLVGLCHLTTSQDGFDVSDEDGEAGLLTDE